MKKIKYVIIASVLGSIFTPTVFAQGMGAPTQASGSVISPSNSTSNPINPNNIQRPPPNPALMEALKFCVDTSAKDANGRPDRQALDNCMRAKGFTKPERPPAPPGSPNDNLNPGQRPPPPPPNMRQNNPRPPAPPMPASGSAK